MKTLGRIFAHLNPLAVVPAGLRLVRKTWGMLRESRTLEQRALTAKNLIARELQYNAVVVAEAEKWHHDHIEVLPEFSWVYDPSEGWKAVRPRIDARCWRKHAIDLAMLRKRHADLWAEVADVYDALALAATGDAPGVTSEALVSLAEGLDRAEL